VGRLEPPSGEPAGGSDVMGNAEHTPREDREKNADLGNTPVEAVIHCALSWKRGQFAGVPR
jgi:hypothetical protein